MQVIKKRSTTEPFNTNKSDGITNYDSWMDDILKEEYPRYKNSIYITHLHDPYSAHPDITFDKIGTDDETNQNPETYIFMKLPPMPHNGILLCDSYCPNFNNYLQGILGKEAKWFSRVLGASGEIACNLYEPNAHKDVSFNERNFGWMPVRKNEVVQIELAIGVYLHETSMIIPEDIFFRNHPNDRELSHALILFY